MGGLGGHMAHLSEDLDLTFQGIIDVLGKVARAEIKNTTEKVDGQNLFLSVDSMGLIRTARNSSDIKKGGMTPDEYIDKWKGHPAESAFTNGFKALTMALKRLDAQTLQDLFSGGERYINLEIMYPKNPNIIHYAAPQVVLHGLKYVGSREDKKEQKRLEDLADEAFKQLSELLDATQSQVGEELWTINGPKVVQLRKLADDSALERVTEEIRDFARPLGVDATLKDLVKLYLRQFAREEGLPEEIIDSMILLVLDPDEAKKKEITVSSLKKGLPPDLKPIVSKLGTKTNSKKVIASILQPLEVAISDFAIEVLRGLQSFFVSEHDKEVIRMRQELEQSIDYLKTLTNQGDVKMGELIDKQLAKLKNVENVASSMEGVVFEYPPGSGKVYKLTGAFAMANQIIGRARRSGMKESLSENITIKISRTRDITKSAQEWINEMRENNHEPGRVPHQVYHDIMNGTPVVDIVKQENAQEVIYNAVYMHINHVLKEEVEFDVVDSAAADPVMAPAGGRVIALVPGAFKPPHSGHLGMVEQYAQEVSSHPSGEVVVLISNPLNANRSLPNGRVITAADSEKIWKIMTRHLGGNVRVEISPHASPITAMYEFIGRDGDLEPGTEVILGVCTKGNDAARFAQANEYVKEGVILRPLENCAVDPVKHSTDYKNILNRKENADLKAKMPSVAKGKDPMTFHASDMRYLLGKTKKLDNKLVIEPAAEQLLVDFVGSSENLAEVLSVFGIKDSQQQMGESSMSGGNMTGGATTVPFGGSTLDRKPKKRKKTRKRRKHNENIDLSLVDEVYELLIERGILL